MYQAGLYNSAYMGQSMIHFCYGVRVVRSLVVPTGVPSSSLGVARGAIVVDNVGIFGDFLGVLLFPVKHKQTFICLRLK